MIIYLNELKSILSYFFQRGSRFEAAQQSNAAQQCDAFTASSELQSAHRAVSIEYDGVVDVVNRIVPWCSQQQQQHQQHNGGHSQRSEPRSPSTLDALLDELKLYSETSQPVRITLLCV